MGAPHRAQKRLSLGFCWPHWVQNTVRRLRSKARSGRGVRTVVAAARKGQP
jgi:hypothetical protein